MPAQDQITALGTSRYGHCHERVLPCCFSPCFQDAVQQLSHLRGNCLLAAFSVVFMPQLPTSYHLPAIKRLTRYINLDSFPSATNFSPTSLAHLQTAKHAYAPTNMDIDPATKARLQLMGLSLRPPLLVDPDGSALAMLKLLNPGVVFHTYFTASLTL